MSAPALLGARRARLCPRSSVMTYLPHFVPALVLSLAASFALVGCGDTDAEAGPPTEQNVTDNASGAVQIFVGEDKQFYFRVVANNKEKVLRSEGYKTRAAAEK